ncbi:MAG: sigma-70 family RNA polymerase sigma factor [Planctomycetota bacterium]
MNPQNFRQTLLEARTGNRDATDRLLRNVHPLVERLARRLASSGGLEASDYAQETTLTAWRTLDQFRGTDTDAGTTAMFRSWIKQILINRQRSESRRENTRKRKDPDRRVVSLEQLRANLRFGSGDPASHEQNPAERFAARETRDLVLGAVASIRHAVDREILVLRFFDDMNLSDIAKRFGLTYDQVRFRQDRALDQLRRRLEPRVRSA